MRLCSTHILFAVLSSAVLAGCSDSSPRYEPPPKKEEPAPRTPTPEEELGIAPPGVLDAAVAAWAKDNELGDYYAQSQQRLEDARSKLLDDYRVRKGMAAAPTSFTKEWLAKYRERKQDDDALRLHILECYSRGAVHPLPAAIRGKFIDASERRRQDAELTAAAPDTLDQHEATLRQISAALDSIGTLTWETRKGPAEWTEATAALRLLSGKAQNLSADASGLSSRLSRLASAKPDDYALSDLERRASRLRRDSESLALRVSDALGIAEGQAALADFAEECRRMEAWIRTLDGRTEAKAARIAEEKEWRRRVVHARKNGNHAEISAAAAALARYRAAMSQDKADGDIACRDVRAFKQYADDKSFRRFKLTLPEGARDGADTLRESLLRAIPSGRNPAGFFDTVESNAFKLHDDYEEKTALSELETAINR